MSGHLLQRGDEGMNAVGKEAEEISQERDCRCCACEGEGGGHVRG